VWRANVLPMSTAADREQIDEVLAQFVDALTSGPDVGQRLARLRNLMLPRAVIVRTCGATPLAMTVEEFIAPGSSCSPAGSSRTSTSGK